MRKKKKIVINLGGPLKYFKGVRKPIPPSGSNMGDHKKEKRKNHCRDKPKQDED